ncbi:MAG TPA: DUF6516 family protein [Anaerolineae bacterium]|nr:DUF6516 family protein [Anaerolineae bacterium]
MKDAADYLNAIKALIVLTPEIIHWEIVREEAQGDVGLFRYRLTLHDGSLLELFELFAVMDREIQVQKYSFHWQTRNGGLIRRWDNAAHHPEVATHPYRIHDGTELNVLPCQPMNAEAIVAIIVETIGLA